jgi:hypothetical protein
MRFHHRARKVLFALPEVDALQKPGRYQDGEQEITRQGDV